MKRHIKPMLAAAILSAVACSPIDNPCNDPDTRQGELSISVSTDEPTRTMITDRMLPDGSEMGIALFDNDGNIYMGKRYEHIRYVAENTQDGQIWKTNSSVFLGATEATLYAYYPYSSYSYDIRDIYVQANSNVQYDFMYGGPYTGLTADNRHASIHLKHALGAVRVCTRRGTYDGVGKISSLGVGGNGVASSGKFDVTQGKFSSLSGGIIYPTTTFQLSEKPNVQDILLIPTGEPGSLTIKMTVDNVLFETSIPDFLLEAGKISQVNVSVDWGMLKVTGVTVQQWYNYERGTASVPTDHRVSLEGNQEGISIGTIIGNDGSVTVTAVPYISKDAKVNPVTFNGEATFSQQMDESTGVRTINIQDIQSGVTVTFDGVSL